MNTASRTAESEVLFDEHASSYDRVNTVISLGLDRRWRRWAARQAVGARPGTRVLDAFSGTGLIGIEAAVLGGRVTMADISTRMQAVSARRSAERGVDVVFVRADLADPAIAVPGSPFDAITVGFGVRYLDDAAAALSHLTDLLVPGGRLVLLEFCDPDEPGALKRAAAWYFFRVLPWLAGRLSGDRGFYDMLARTTRELGGPDTLPRLAEKAGLVVREVRRMGFGLVVGVVAEKR